MEEGPEPQVHQNMGREKALADAVVRLGAQAAIDAADSDYRAGTLSELEAPSDEPCPARGDDGVCQPGHPEDVSACMHCGDPVALDAPIEGALELPEYVAPRHRAAAVRAFVRAYNEQMRALRAAEEA